MYILLLMIYLFSVIYLALFPKNVTMSRLILTTLFLSNIEMHTGLIFLLCLLLDLGLIMLLGLETVGLAFSFGHPYSVLLKIV